MNRTKIEWVKNPDGTQGYTWNPITGCLNGCEYCYARRLANGRLKQRYLANHYLSPLHLSQNYYKHDKVGKAECDPFYPRFWEERLSECYTYGRNFSDSDYKMHHHKGIFVCDMGELFGDWVPREWQEKIFHVIKSCSQHRFYLLTKQPQNLIKWSPFPSNCWVGVSATNVEQYKQALVGLAVIEARIRYISFEPLLEYIPTNPPYDLDGIDWVILGGQTSPEKQPPLGAVNAILNAAEIAGAKVFMKNNLAWQFHRQEMPAISEVKDDTTYQTCNE